jgi:hypothetical protein
MKETAVQVMFFMKDEQQEKKVIGFLKRYEGEMLLTVPVPIKPQRKKK